MDSTMNTMDSPTKLSLHILLLCVFMGVSFSQTTLPTELQGNPCTHSQAIQLPQSNKCLVLVKDARNWLDAQGTCEAAGGNLYNLPSARLYTRPHLMDCLSSYNESGYTDLWLNGVTVWSPQFFWTNRTLVNKVSYCPPYIRLPQDQAAITSSNLSVDYCHSTCHDQGAPYTVLYNSGASPSCKCVYILEKKYEQPCPSTRFFPADRSKYFIVKSEESSLIKVGSADTFSSSQIMCATVDDQTIKTREMKSDTCFTQRPFICELGTAEECKNRSVSLRCVEHDCLFLCANKCLKRVSLPYSWYAARSYCGNLGGDLWKMNDLDDMSQVTQYLHGQSRYWIGATNYAWDFNMTYGKMDQIQMRTGSLRCGHMFREKTTGAVGRTWSWSDGECQQKKSFICEFDHKQFGANANDQEVKCPWEIIYTEGITTLFPLPGSTALAAVSRDDSFPWAAVIAGIIAGLTLLTCLGLAAAFCGRRHWKKVREHLTFIPYFSDNSHVVMGNSHDFENMSQVGHSRSHMSSVSEHGSQVGLVKGGYSSYGMSNSAYQSDSNGMFSSKSLDRKHMESMGHKLADSQNYLSSFNNSMDERGFAASYSTMPSKQKEYMTLQAQMEIQDDAQLEAMRRSLRGKPEMTLVTDNVDMNLTVNHASSPYVSGVVTGNGISGGETTMTQAVMEEVILPGSDGGVILTFPERVEEAHVYSTGTTTAQHPI